MATVLEAESAERTPEGLSTVRVGLGLDSLRPDAGLDTPTLISGSGAAVPAHLLHVVVELDDVAVRGDDMQCVIDPRIQLLRQIEEENPFSSRKALAARSCAYEPT